ncbi:hypothetical protein RvY_15403 [Ramazzottius varieornatus]|uniref:NADH dehydrogenase [ubiquinone] 1 beta subcomplex subunit 9 n=1 Tax=Ramazzottius varieornatus TaxID=947166 RepID=A0A1D1VUT6_RAMVA|nr:hypothetical protein RvY_15403 [Ramazzottius varieornatus]
MTTNYLTTRAISHREQVCALYKKAVRTMEAYWVIRADVRYQAVMMRHRFDQNKDIKDMRIAVKLLRDGEEELFMNQHPIPFQYQYSPGGSAYGRVPYKPDWLVDSWHPLEKASYPKYFAQREKRKDEWVKYWEDHYNKGQKFDDHEPEWHGNWDEKLPGEKVGLDPHKKVKPHHH